MIILLTNDDGFDAPGIQELYKVLSTKHEVWIMAPDGNKSGYSSSLTMFRDMNLVNRGKNLWALEGSPVDCVNTAHMSNVFPSRPDVVISGINNGANMGRDVIYSGTCGGAREGSLHGTPSIAVSLEKEDWSSPEPYRFTEMAQFLLENLDSLVSLCGKKVEGEKSGEDCIGRPYFVNINALSVEKWKGVKAATLCHKSYRDRITIREDEDGTTKAFLEIVGADSYGADNCDETVVRQGYVSISLIPAEITASFPSNLEETGLFTV